MATRKKKTIRHKKAKSIISGYTKKGLKESLHRASFKLSALGREVTTLAHHIEDLIEDEER